jgi:hypothetical protein
MQKQTEGEMIIGMTKRWRDREVKRWIGREERGDDKEMER